MRGMCPKEVEMEWVFLDYEIPIEMNSYSPVDVTGSRSQLFAGTRFAPFAQIQRIYWLL